MRAMAMLLAAAMLVWGIGAATAADQSLPPDAGTQPAQPRVPGGKDTPSTPVPQSGSTTAPGSLSHELDRSGGVIHPPATGDEGVIAPPNQGKSATPVIPPPGSPGGNPQVQPK